MQLVQVFVPVIWKEDPARFASEVGNVVQELTERFGGATFTQHLGDRSSQPKEPLVCCVLRCPLVEQLGEVRRIPEHMRRRIVIASPRRTER